MRTLIKNGIVITVDPERQVYPCGFVTVEDARIADIGPASQTPSSAGFDEVIDASGSVVVPGLINMHQHHW